MTDLVPPPRSQPEPRPASTTGPRRVDPRSDAHLLAAALDGDGTAFGEFYQRHVTRLFAYFRPRSGGPQDAYDLVSETFAQALQSLHEFDPDRGEPGGWLFGIAKNKHRRYARRGAVETRGRQRMELFLPRLSDDALVEIEESIDLDAVRRRLEPAIEALPDTLRDAVRLRCLDVCDYDEIASQLGIRPATARKRVSRGLRHLEDLVGDNPFLSHD